MSWREQLDVGELTVRKSLTFAALGGSSGASIDSGIVLGDMTTGIEFNGTQTTGIDFSDMTYVPTGSNGPSLIRCGTYASPLSHAVEAQSGLFRIYMETTADGSSYDRGIFVCLKTYGTKSILPVASLAEVKTQTGVGPNQVMAGQFISNLIDADAAMPTGGFGLFGVWAKIAATSGATIAVGTKAAAIWVDNQLNGVGIGSGGALATEYGIYATAGGSVPKAFVGFSTTSGGYANLFQFDATFSTSMPPCNGGVVDTDGGDSAGSLKIEIDGTAYKIPFFS